MEHWPSIQQLIERHPTFGYRRLWALLRFGEGIRVNRKAVYRVLRLKGWLVHQRTVTPRPRVQGVKSRANHSDERWAMDLTHIPCGADGWGHLTAVIDCHDREVTGYDVGYNRNSWLDSGGALQSNGAQRCYARRPATIRLLLHSISQTLCLVCRNGLPVARRSSS
jgi:putative transposase